MGLMENITAMFNAVASNNKLDAAVIAQQAIPNEPVNSSWIDSATYNPLTKALTIDTIEGLSYTYFNVSEAVYQQFEMASSKGAFINTVIKNGIFPYTRS